MLKPSRRSEQRRVRQQLGGIAVFDAKQTPRFEAWGPICLAYQTKYLTRPDIFQRTLAIVLEFWGTPPTLKKKAPAVPRPAPARSPYHDLRLGDPIADPQWILKFERWMDARGVSASTRNSYLSALSTCYTIALQPEYRAVARVPSNPFEYIRRSRPNRRVVALEPAVLLRWIGEASRHVALAATIAALAPKMRLQTILELQWSQFDRDFRRVTVYGHKTARHTGLPQVTPISTQLREILQAYRAQSSSKWLITWKGEPVASIKRGARAAAERIGLTWGVAGGVTFHTIRHSIATICADLGLAEALRKELMGHKEIRTTQQYTHLSAQSQVGPHEQLSAALPLKAIMMPKLPQPKPARAV